MRALGIVLIGLGLMLGATGGILAMASDPAGPVSLAGETYLIGVPVASGAAAVVAGIALISADRRRRSRGE